MTWLRLKDAAAYAKVSPRLLYQAARTGELRVARVGRGRNMVTSVEWVDSFLVSTTTAVPASSSSVTTERSL